jgi:hypothetical protein
MDETSSEKPTLDAVRQAIAVAQTSLAQSDVPGQVIIELEQPEWLELNREIHTEPLPDVNIDEGVVKFSGGLVRRRSPAG